MALLNHCEGIGRFGSDGIVKTTQNGNKTITVSFATNEFENGKTIACWCNLYFDYNKYQNLLPYIKKGKEVFICGTTVETPYINKKGEAAIDKKIFVSHLQFCGSRGNNDNTTQQPSVTISKTSEAPKVQEVTTQSSESEDLPF